jgi:hypothetical protein
VTTMARIKWIIRTRKAWSLLVVLALLAVVVQTVAFSGASFTGRTTNNASFSAGNVKLTNDHDGQIIIDTTASPLRPGEASAVVTVTLTNAGDFTGPVTLTRGAVIDTPATPAFSSVVHLVVVDAVGGATLYNNAVGSMGTITLATLAPGASHAYRFNLLFDTPDSNPNLQGHATSVGLLFTLGTS